MFKQPTTMEKPVTRNQFCGKSKLFTAIDQLRNTLDDRRQFNKRGESLIKWLLFTYKTRMQIITAQLFMC